MTSIRKHSAAGLGFHILRILYVQHTPSIDLSCYSICELFETNWKALLLDPSEFSTVLEIVYCTICWRFILHMPMDLNRSRIEFTFHLNRSYSASILSDGILLVWLQNSKQLSTQERTESSTWTKMSTVLWITKRDLSPRNDIYTSKSSRKSSFGTVPGKKKYSSC